MTDSNRLRSSLVTALVLTVGLVLGGTVLRGPVADAASWISGSRLQDHTVPGKKLINNTITGAQVQESSLARVPDAARLSGQAASAFLPSANQWHFSRPMTGQTGTEATARLGSMAGLIFNGRCLISGSTIYSTIDVTPTHEGVIANGRPVGMASTWVLTNDGDVQNKSATVDVAIVDPSTGLALDGQFTSVIHTAGADCRFFGHLVRDDR